MIWAQAICIKLGGLNEFTARFPSAISAMLTAFFVFVFVLYLTGNGWAALLSGIVLCTAKGYHAHHCTRYGDYDAMLVFFCTASLLSVFLFTEVVPVKKSKLLYVFFTALALGVLTKGIQILIFAPGILIYLLLQKQLIITLKNKHTYIAAGGFLLATVGYLFLREHYSPGYLQALNNNEVMGRVTEVIDGHEAPFSYYFDNFKFQSFGNWFWALPVFSVLCPFLPNGRQKRFALFLILCFSVYLLVISISLTKVFWYDLPLYPLLAIAVALTVNQLAALVSFIVNGVSKKVILILLVVIFSIQPVYEIYFFIAAQKSDDYDCYPNYFYASYFLRNALDNGKNLDNFTFLSVAYNLERLLYLKELKEERNVNIQFETLSPETKFETGRKIMAHEARTKEFVETNYTVHVIEEDRNIRLYEIIGVKP
jgi:4-amino-4-deoxy-L-arabinose transferase-like glycosyltransferase